MTVVLLARYSAILRDGRSCPVIDLSPAAEESHPGEPQLPCVPVGSATGREVTQPGAKSCNEYERTDNRPARRALCTDWL